MPVLDLRDMPAADPIEADLCIIGSGPAGATIASELAPGHLRVVVLESGGLARQASADALNEIENVGRPRELDQWNVRNRVLGGSSATWGGRCTVLDSIDYEARDWVPHSGWPIAAEQIEPYLQRAAPYLGLIIGSDPGDAFWSLAGRPDPMPAIDKELLVSMFWQFARDRSNPLNCVRFSERLMSLRGTDVRVLVNATVTHINLNHARTAVESVEVRSTDGEHRLVSARCVVLCAGGIENARLLLASNRQIQAGVGNQNDLVGRYLMDHPRGKIGSFDPARTSSLQRWLGVYNAKTPFGSNLFWRGLRLSPNMQRKLRLLNCVVFLEPELAADDPLNALKQILRGRPSARNAMIVASHAGWLAKGLHRYFVERNGLPRKLDRLNLTCIVEQRPDPDSRITLADRTDLFGVPLSRIDWRVGDQERATVRSVARMVEREFRRLSIEAPAIEAWVTDEEPLPVSFLDHGHPAGTTRMSRHPERGVVDPDCEVYGVNGLFVSGASVFPTVGHANPAHMIVAMAVRLSDTLKKRLAMSTA
ncbi:MAG: GMC family oxidoreductase [Bradyrhizobium sp.]|uniref:GMC oxidoreductase n=1 Tax=Bradyrhizobium sp. TaxID=376 RepID=UPI001DC3B9D1|nr:GMC family oxidoreductase [Bradyrhizobium sp.]MBV9561736.1 GMC family oxidoreductase [Bradyrhizobium sp.]